MKAIPSLSVLVVICSLLLVACEKKEKPYPLPPPGDAQNAQISMGKDYEMQVFFSFENGVIDSSRNNSWDLSFSSIGGRYDMTISPDFNFRIMRTLHGTTWNLVVLIFRKPIGNCCYVVSLIALIYLSAERFTAVLASLFMIRSHQPP